MQKHLFLCRHAHTLEATSNQKDFDRQLSPAGLTEAQLTAEFISGFNLKPELIICSSARRTFKTAEILAAKNNYAKSQLKVSDILYNAPTPKLLKVISELPEDLNVAVLVGHNPAVSELASTLIGKHRRQIPTGGCCYFSFNEPDWQAIEWAEIKYKLNF